MKEEHKKKVRKSVLNSKAQLEEDLSKQLKQYGIFPDRLVDVEKLDLTGEKKQKRKDLEEILEKIEHKDTGDKTEQEYYVRKAAYTYFNRLAALKLMESHSLLDNVITPNSEFGGQPELLFHYRDITDIQNEDTLYESYFTGIFDDLDQEIGKIFDMDDQTSLLFPSSNVVDTVIEELDNIPQEAWKEEEIIGWMYQYFISEEKDDAFDKLNNDDQKINGSTLPAVTSLYTPHWIVEYLVDNTLGVMWKEMHPDTEIEKICDYIVPDQEFEEREPKDIEEITLLDPACGSGHFLLYAFDVFLEMYKEEGYDEEEIPKKILENNLYGIDVDNRSSQLSALALYVKAKELTPDAEISQLNIISADAVLMNGEKKEKLLEKCDLSVEKEVIEEIWDNFQHLDERGSLVKIEEPVRQKISEHKAQLSQEDNKQRFLKQFTDQEIREKQSTGQQKLAESVSTEEYWNAIEDRMVHRVRELGEEAIQAQDMSEQLFAAETEKTLHLLDYLMEDYDIVATNPPYSNRSNLSESLRGFLDKNFPESSQDLYSSFIQRASDFSDKYVGMVTQDTFMFLSAYENLRNNLLTQTSMKTMNHLGTHAFDEIKGEKVRSVAFTLSNSHTYSECSCLRLVNEDNKEAETKDVSSENFFQVKTSDFSKIEGKPFVYWISDEFRSVFNKYPPLESNGSGFAELTNGLFTCNNPKFIRHHWEVPSDTERWHSYVKGSTAHKWYRPVNKVVEWIDDGETIKDERESSGQSRSLPGSDYYFEEGLVFNRLGNEANIAYMASGHIFDINCSAIFPRNKKDGENIYYLLSLLNSSFSKYVLSLLNPSLASQIGDLRRIPVKEPDNKSFFKKTGRKLVDLQKEQRSAYETDPNFKQPALLNGENFSVKKRFEIHTDQREEREIEISEKELEIDQNIFEIYNLEENDIEFIKKEIEGSASKYSDENLGQTTKEKLEEYYLQGKEVPWRGRTKTEKLDIRDISQELEVHPRSVLEARKELDIYREDDLEEEVKRLLSYFIQVSLGRWEIGGVEPTDDGILMVSTEVSNDSPSLMDKIRECIAAEWGQENVSDIESEINNILYHGMEKWIKKYFFKNFHYKMYNKRPVVWEIKTPNDHFKAFIYYHELDEDTLPKLQVDYIEPLMTEYNNRKNLAKENGNTAEAEKLEDKVEDLRQLKEQLDEVIEEGYSPDLDEGVKHNFKPVENMTSKEMK